MTGTEEPKTEAFGIDKLFEYHVSYCDTYLGGTHPSSEEIPLDLDPHKTTTQRMDRRISILFGI